MFIAAELGERWRRISVGRGRATFRCLGLFPLDLEPVDLDDLVVCVIAGVCGSQVASQSVHTTSTCCLVDVDALPCSEWEQGRGSCDRGSERGEDVPFDAFILTFALLIILYPGNDSRVTMEATTVENKRQNFAGRCAFFVGLERPRARPATVDLRSYEYEMGCRSGLYRALRFFSMRIHQEVVKPKVAVLPITPAACPGGRRSGPNPGTGASAGMI